MGDKSTPTSGSKSNYDRWKAGTKLACMMALKRIASNEDYYDIHTQKFSSTTWHIVAENLNKDYPGYAKRFTNVNVKDRYDRVMKHHRVFKRMANRLSGFRWNAELFGFEATESDLIAQYDQGIRVDPLIKKESNVVRFLMKPGHIDLEYFHRYIYQVPQSEAPDDMVINSPSYIEDAISKGVLTSNTVRPAFIKDPSSSTTTTTTTTTTTNNSSSNGGSSNDLPLTHHGSGSASLQNSSAPSVPVIHQGSLSIPSNNMHSNSMSSAAGLQGLHQSSAGPQFQTPMGVLPPMMQPGIVPPNALLSANQFNPHMHQPPPQLPQPQQHPIQHPSQQHPSQEANGTPVNSQHQQQQVPSQQQQQPQQQQQQQQQQSELDFSVGLMDPTQNSMMAHMSPMASISLNDGVDPDRSRKRMRTSTPSNVIQSGMLFDSFELQQGAQDGGVGGRTTGDTLMIIHKEFEIMKNEVGEKVLQLRMNKIIEYEDFVALQDVIESHVPFLRSAFKRLRDDQKLVELINVYLNKGP